MSDNPQNAKLSTPEPDRELVDDLVLANRILFNHGVVDAFGHVSVRHDKKPDRFLLARNMAPALVKAEDVIEFDLEGNAINANGRGVFLERFIHGSIYRERPDVNAVIHSHAPEVVPFGVVAGAGLKPLWHMSGFLGEDVPVFEIRDVAGDETNLLIRDNDLGVALAKELGSACVVLMRGHGATVVAANLKEAVFRAVYTQLNAEIQLHARQLGPITFLSQGEAAATNQAVSSQVGRAWTLWKDQLTPASNG